MYTGTCSSLEVFLVAANIIITLPFIESYSIDEKNETKCHNSLPILLNQIESVRLVLHY